MGRTNIVIDEKLIRRAGKLTGLRTKREIVHRALELLVRAESRKGILKYYGSGISQDRGERISVPRKAMVKVDGRGQTIQLPREFWFNAREVFIRKRGDSLVLSTRPFDWSTYLKEGPRASETFMDGV